MVKHTQTIRWHFVGFALKGLTSRRELFSQKAPSQMFDRIVNTSLSRANCKKKGKLWDSSLAFREVLASTEWKVSKYGVLSGPYFPVFSPGAGKCRPEKTPYLDTFHALEYPSTYFHWTLMLVLTCQSLSYKTEKNFQINFYLTLVRTPSLCSSLCRICSGESKSYLLLRYISWILLHI